MNETDLQDAILRHSLQILRLSANEQAEVDQILADLEAELKQLLQSQNLTEVGKRELQGIINDAEKLIDPAFRAAASTTDFRELVVIVAEHASELVGGLMPSDAVIDSLSKDVIVDGSPAADWWARQGEDLAFRFAGQVRQGVINGETNERIVGRIVGRRGEPGIMDLTRRNARSLVATSVMTAANEARLATFRKSSRFISGVRWLATLDGHTCPRCMALDGQGWDLDGNKLPGTKVEFMAPPIHFNDRCVLSPIPKESEAFASIDAALAKTATRASANGPIKASTSFDEFLSRQTDAFVENVLGAERAALFRAGKITVRDLVSGTGRELTMTELRAKVA